MLIIKRCVCRAERTAATRDMIVDSVQSLQSLVVPCLNTSTVVPKTQATSVGDAHLGCGSPRLTPRLQT